MPKNMNEAWNSLNSRLMTEGEKELYKNSQITPENTPWYNISSKNAMLMKQLPEYIRNQTRANRLSIYGSAMPTGTLSDRTRDTIKDIGSFIGVNLMAGWENGVNNVKELVRYVAPKYVSSSPQLYMDYIKTQRELSEKGLPPANFYDFTYKKHFR